MFPYRDGDKLLYYFITKLSSLSFFNLLQKWTRRTFNNNYPVGGSRSLSALFATVAAELHAKLQTIVHLLPVRARCRLVRSVCNSVGKVASTCLNLAVTNLQQSCQVATVWQSCISCWLATELQSCNRVVKMSQSVWVCATMVYITI